MNRDEFSEVLRSALLDALGHCDCPFQATKREPSSVGIGVGSALRFDLGGITIERLTVELPRS